MAKPMPDWRGRKPERTIPLEPKARAAAWKAATERRQATLRRFEQVRRVAITGRLDLGRIRRQWKFGPRGTVDFRKAADKE